MPYEHVDIAGDAGLRATGPSLCSTLEDLALGMYALITPLEGIASLERVSINIESADLSGLVVAYLNELVFLFDARGFLAHEVRITNLTDTTLCAELLGEGFDSSRHEGNMLIKAATYHGLKVYEHEGLWTIEVVLDI